MRSALLELPELPEARPVSLPQRGIRYGRQAPGQLSLMLAALLLLCLGTGLAGMLDIQHRRATLAGVAERSGPLTTAAEEIYQSISDADATVAGAFLIVGGIETKDLRERYQLNIREAAAALSTAAAGAPAGESADAVGKLAVYLPIYAGLIEDARTLNRPSQPEGGAYLRQASALAQRTMLPLAEQLFRDETGRLADAQDDADGFPWFPVAVGILALACLIAAQVYLARTTNRILNRGLLVATAATLVGLVWFVLASTSAAGHASSARERGSAQVEAVAAARIAVLQARSDEALTLVARGGGAEYETHFAETAKKLNGPDGLLARAVAATAGSEPANLIGPAISAWNEWSDRHVELRNLDKDGDFAGAVLFATTGEKGTAEPAARVDARLGQAIADATARLTVESARGRSAVASADLAVAVLVLLAGIAVAMGFAPRLREFR